MRQLFVQNGMKLYHGTDTYFGKIQIVGHSSQFHDFGAGFYLTSFFGQARSQAQRKARQNAHKGIIKPAYVYKYEVRSFDHNNYRILELLNYDKNWLDFLKYNRLYGGKEKGAPEEWQNLDIVYDRMADNRFNVIADDLKSYAKNEMDSIDVISHLARYRDWDQYCFKTDKALKLLVRIEIADVSE